MSGGLPRCVSNEEVVWLLQWVVLCIDGTTWQYVTQSVSLPPLEDWDSCGESSLARLSKNKNIYNLAKQKMCIFLTHTNPNHYHSIYNTRHSEPTRHMLTIPHYDYKRHKSFKHLSNSYFYSAPRIWNSLSETCRCASSLSSFRAHLKTYLWTKSFPP